MLIPVVPTNSRKRPAKAKPAAAPVVLPNQIVSIQYDEMRTGYIVTVSNPLNGFEFQTDVWFFTIFGTEETAQSGALIDETHIAISMGFDVEGTEVWNLTDTSGMEFVDGEVMVGPFSGSFPWP